MKKIFISGLINKGKFFLIDDDDYDKLSNYNWYLKKWNRGFYCAFTFISKKMILAHRLIMNAKKGDIIDHKNRNPLDNRKSNLRFANQTNNNYNTRRFRGKHGLKGITYCTNENRKLKWKAQIKNHGKNINLGYFDNKEDAHNAYISKLKELAGEFYPY